MNGTKISVTERKKLLKNDNSDLVDVASPSDSGKNSINFDSKKPQVAVIKNYNLSLNMGELVERRRRLN